MPQFHPDTLALHGGQIIGSPEMQKQGSSRGVPVHRTSAYLFQDTEQAARLFAQEEEGFLYSRLGNPTQEVLEKRIAALEGGSAALALASGTAATFYSIINICSQGDSIISASNLYGGTYTMFNAILPQFGITTDFVDARDTANVASAITETTRAVFIETIGNPGLDLVDIEAIANIAHKHGLPLLIDSTFTTPFLLRPFEYGADIVIHSLTKWLGGHGTAIGGAVIESGKFNWGQEKFPLFNEADASYHGLRFGHDLGDKQDQAFTMRMRAVQLRNLGACISPDNAWIFLQGLETVHLRMERHSSNALAVAEFLEGHPAVAWVKYPGLSSHPSHALAQKYLPRGAGGMVVFGVNKGAEGGAQFINSLKLLSHVSNVGDAKSLATHPASTTHAQLTPEEQKSAGVSPELIRLSIGIEHPDDIIADLDQALASL